MITASRAKSGFTLIELLVVVAITIAVTLLSLGFNFQQKTAADQRTAFAEDVENLFSAVKVQSLIGRGVSVAGAIVVPDEVRVRVRTGSVTVVYYSGGTVIGTGQTLAYPFRNNPDFEIGWLRITDRDQSVTDVPAANFDVVYTRNDVSFTGASLALATAVSAELQVGYRNAYQAIEVDRRANRIDVQDACTSGGCCRERANYLLDGYAWNVPTLSIGQSTDSIAGTADLPNGTRVATRSFTCQADMTFLASAIVEQPAVCDAGYSWNAGTSSCLAMSCPATSELILDGYSWNVGELQLATTSLPVTGTKTVSSGIRTATRTFTCRSDGILTGNAMTENAVSCNSGYTWSGATSSCLANNCAAGNYQSSGYTWTVPAQVSGNVSSSITSAPITITNGTRTATRTFTCIAGVRTPGAVTLNPGLCQGGYFWSTTTQACRSNVCEADTTLTLNGYIWNAPYQDPNQTTPSALTGSRTIPNGIRLATAKLTCDATGNRGITQFTELPGTCSAGYVWNSTSSACVASACFSASYATSEYVFAFPSTASGASAGVLTGTKTIANGVRTATASFSCINAAITSGSLTVSPTAICNAGYTWNSTTGLCEGALCAANPSYSADGYVWSVPSVPSGQTSAVITGSKAITNGTIYAYRTFSCDAGTFSPNALTQNPNGTCNSGYTWNLSLRQCEGLPCQADSALTASGFTFSVPYQMAGYASAAISGTKSVPNGVARARATFSCDQGVRAVATWTTDSGLCNSGYYWDAVNMLCPSVLPPGGVNGTSGIVASNITGTSFTVSWQSSTGATAYEISIDNGVTWTNVGSALTYNASGLTPMATYQVRLRAKNDSQTSSPSAAVPVTTTLSAPVLSAATNVGLTSFTMNWSAVSGASGYEISTNNWSTWTNVGNVTSYNVTGLVSATDYQTVVRAKYSSSNSQTSNMVTTRTSRTVNCGGTVPANATANATTTYTQAWNGSAWTPTTNWTNGSSSATCGFACNSGYTWNGSACQVGSQTASCNGSIPTNATASTASTYTQTWDGSAYSPSGVSWSNGTATCGFICNSGYVWNGTACAVSSTSCAGGSKAMINPSNGKCYILSSGTATWSSAQSSCVSLGGRLASVNNSQIQSFLSNNGYYSNNPWIGANDIASEGSWTWDAGDSWSYSAWNDGEPNNSGDEDCAHVKDGLWNDEYCGGGKYYICQKNISYYVSSGGPTTDVCNNGTDILQNGASCTNPNSWAPSYTNKWICVVNKSNPNQKILFKMPSQYNQGVAGGYVYKTSDGTNWNSYAKSGTYGLEVDSYTNLCGGGDNHFKSDSTQGWGNCNDADLYNDQWCWMPKPGAVCDSCASASNYRNVYIRYGD